MSNDLGAFDGSSSSRRRAKLLDPVNVMTTGGKPSIPPITIKRSKIPMAKTKVSTKTLTKPIKDSHPKKSSSGQKPMPTKMTKGGKGKAC